ncbi:MAG: ribbon-helix-helix domain-containing protein [Acidobacteriota bacterium]|nr:ribbon-helix-helix domain-containing protein [Acidobacteriota bacterium]
MPSLYIELPDKLSGELQRLVQAGWFQTEQEVIRLALAEFMRRHKTMLSEQFQREDIAWALTQAQQKQAEQ